MNLTFDLTVSLGVITTVVLAVVGWIRARWGGLDARITDQSARLDRHESRIASAEQTLKSMPGTSDVHRLHLEMAEMKGEMREMRAIMEGSNQIMGRLETIVTRHEDHLLEGRR